MLGMISPLRGIVVRGKQIARTLGYPTANIEYKATQAPEGGVWTCMVQAGNSNYQGLAVIDMWKQSDGLPSLEVHLLQFEGDLYHQELVVTLRQKLHEIRAFTSEIDLIKQIEEDVRLAQIEFSFHQKPQA